MKLIMINGLRIAIPDCTFVMIGVMADMGGN